MNDIVLSILELLKVYERVMYIEIDVHHGVGVEEAFYAMDCVMACAFFRSRFLPRVGHAKRNCCRGITDDSYDRVFKPVIQRIMDVYDAKAVLLECGADSLA